MEYQKMKVILFAWKKKKLQGIQDISLEYWVLLSEPSIWSLNFLTKGYCEKFKDKKD